MLWRSVSLTMLGLMGLGLFVGGVHAQGNEAYQKVTKAAIKKVAPSVVQIVTQGGTNIVVVGKKGAKFRKALGPTTGVVVSEDGYVISSAFNFINKPATILIEVPGRKEKYVAKRVATDTSRMLTLLKIDAKGLPVPEIAPESDIQIGQWAFALGRTLDFEENNLPSVHVGIISAKNRVWGKCLQTDANTSPANYGGALIDIKGRVQGIIVPASPRGDGATAGTEWYDSGIGFAVPLEDVMAILPRLKKGRDLKKGLLGVQLRSRDYYSTQPVVARITPDSAAARAGLRSGDVITKIEGKKVVRFAQILHLLGPKYEGDFISLTYKRGAKETTIPKLQLVGKLTAFVNAYMGILPMRDDPKLGVQIRYVYPESPAAEAKLAAGDRIVGYTKDKKMMSFAGKERSRNELMAYVNTLRPGTPLVLNVQRKGGAKMEKVTVKLGEFPGTAQDKPDAPPEGEELPEIASLKKALVPIGGAKKPAPKQPKKDGEQNEEENIETGLLKRKTASGNSEYWLYVHENYDPNVSQALLVWIHPPNQGQLKDVNAFTEMWDPACLAKNILIAIPKNVTDGAWRSSDSEIIADVISDVTGKYTVDKKRVVTHGISQGGQMAIYMGFNARNLVRGVAVSGAVPKNIKENVTTNRLQLFVVGGDRDPVFAAIEKGVTELQEKRLPVTYRGVERLGRQYMPTEILIEMIRWMDCLDRI